MMYLLYCLSFVFFSNVLFEQGIEGHGNTGPPEWAALPEGSLKGLFLLL